MPLSPSEADAVGSRAVGVGSPQRADGVRVLVALCGTVTISYGILYYAFTVLGPSIATDTGWSRTSVTGAFSAGSLVGAVAGISVGRFLQRRGPRLVMTAGSLLGALAVTLVALAPSYPVFLVAWLLVGMAGAATFYPPAFAALTQWFGARRVRAITTLTLVAGFASTIFAPLTATLDDALGWRGTYLVLAVVLLITAPVHGLALRLPWSPAPTSAPPQGHPDRHVVRSRTFVLVTAAGTLTSLVMYASLVNLVPLLLDRGLAPQLAAWALGLSGAGQVAGRLLYPALDRRFPPHVRAAAVIVVLAASLAAFSVVQGPGALLIVIAVLGGAARGLFTLISATVVADHWGSERYAALSGVYYAPLGVAAALAPGLGAAVAALTGSYAALFGVLAVLGGLAALLAMAAGTSAAASSRTSARSGSPEGASLR